MQDLNGRNLFDKVNSGNLCELVALDKMSEWSAKLLLKRKLGDILDTWISANRTNMQFWSSWDSSKPSLNMDSTFKLICSDFKCFVTNIFRYEADNAKGDEKAPTLFGGRFRGYLVFDTG